MDNIRSVFRYSKIISTNIGSGKPTRSGIIIGVGLWDSQCLHFRQRERETDINFNLKIFFSVHQEVSGTPEGQPETWCGGHLVGQSKLDHFNNENIFWFSIKWYSLFLKFS